MSPRSTNEARLEDAIYYSIGGGSEEIVDSYLPVLQDYFQLNVPLKDLSEKWALLDSNFKTRFGYIRGLRVLRQDPLETLFAFICSANNNIPRITSLVGCLYFVQ